MKSKKCNHPYRSTGKRICEIRNYMESQHNKRKLSQEQFSEILDIDSKLLSRLETGVQEISSSVLLQLSQVSGKSMEYILTGMETKVNNLEEIETV